MDTAHGRYHKEEVEANASGFIFTLDICCGYLAYSISGDIDMSDVLRVLHDGCQGGTLRVWKFIVLVIKMLGA
jgi:hypothetical protein